MQYNTSLREPREPLRPPVLAVDNDRPSIRLVSQVIVDLAVFPSSKSFQEVISECLKWLSNRTGGIPLPGKAWNGETFDLGQTVGAMDSEAIRVSETFWVMRNNFQDPNVPRRIWLTEVQVAKASKIVFGIRLTCITRGDNNPPFNPTVPGVILQISEKFGISSTEFKLGETPLRMRDDDDLESLCTFIENKRRRIPVIVISETAGLPVKSISKQCIGIACVVTVPDKLLPEFLSRWGFSFSVPHSGCRTFNVGFDEDQEPFRHPWATKESIGRYGQGGIPYFVERIVQKAFDGSVRYEKVFDDMPRFSAAKQVYLENQRLAITERTDTSQPLDEIASLQGKLFLAEQELQESKKNVAEWKFFALDEERLANQYKEEMEASAKESYILRQRLQMLSSFSALSKELESELPQNLTDVLAWAETELAGKLVMHPRTRRSLNKGLFEDVEKVCSALKLLANEYRMMKTTGTGRGSYEEGKKRLNLSESKSMRDSRYGEFKEQYEVSYNGRKVRLEDHLKSGTGDERHCLRIYFNWDAETQQVIVGWLPSHLDTRQT